MTLPNVSLGNTFTDVGEGTNTFIKGMLESRDRAKQLALQEAMAAAKMAETMGSNYTLRPAINPTSNRLEYARIDQTGQRPTQYTGDHAPEYQMSEPLQDANGNFIPGTRSRAIPNSPISAVPMPEGMRPRTPQVTTPTVTDGQPSLSIINPGNPGQPGRLADFSEGTSARPAPAMPMQVETPTGPAIVQVPRTYGQGGSGSSSGSGSAMGQSNGLLRPRADEGDERRARDSFEMIQASRELDIVVARNPNAYNEAAGFIASRNFLDGIPVIGDALDQVLAAAQNTLSAEGAMYVRAWTQAGAARAFARGGATLTANEIKWSTDALGPRMGDDEAIKAQRKRLLTTVIFGMTRGNVAWQRYRDPARQMGFNLDEAINTLQPPQFDGKTDKYGIRRK